MTVQAPSRVRLAPITIDRSRVAIDVMCGLAATGVLLSAVVHFDLWYAQGFREVDTIGPLFLLNAIGGLVIGLVLICWGTGCRPWPRPGSARRRWSPSTCP